MRSRVWGTVVGMLTSPFAFLPARVARAYDRCPLAPHQLAEMLLDWRYDRDEARCATDPTWAAIEARRHEPGKSSVILFSDEHDLGWDEQETQHEICARLCPDPWWRPLAYAVKDRPLRHLRWNATQAWQRARRGWAVEDTYNLGGTLAARLAEQLEYLAKYAHGYPTSVDTFDDWQAALVEQAGKLRAWVDAEDSPAAKAYHATLRLGFTEEQREAAREEYRADSDARLAGAQDALRWVADHLAELWD